MKLLIASDLHGSAHYCRLLLDAFRREEAERLVLLACGQSAGGSLLPGRTLTLPLPPPGAELITVMPGQSAESLCLRCGMSRERFALINSLSAPLYPGMRVLVERSR